MARSSPAPSLRTPEGARLTVIRLSGHVRPLDSSAARTRSRDSRQAVSGRPTTVKLGSPCETYTSTSTGWPLTPSSVADGTMAITSYLYFLVCRHNWGYSLSGALALFIPFVAIGLSFFSANFEKINARVSRIASSATLTMRPSWSC